MLDRNSLWDIMMSGYSSDSSSIEEEREVLLPIYRLSPTVAPHPDFWNDPFFKECEVCLLRNGCVLGVRNQGRTDGCFAISVVTSLYGDMCVNKHEPEPCHASAQELVDWLYRILNNRPPWAVSEHGTPNGLDDAYEYVMRYGLYPEDVYPWEARCNDPPRKGIIDEPEIKVYINGYNRIDDDNHSEVIEMLKRQPVVAGMLAAYSNVKDGILQGPTDEELATMEKRLKISKLFGLDYTPNHAISLVGFGGTEGIDDYYLCQNSYGPDWGHHGYFKIRRKAVFSFYYPIGTNRRERKDIAELAHMFERLYISEPIVEVHISEPLDALAGRMLERLDISE